jgi:hypothetical protein
MRSAAQQYPSSRQLRSSRKIAIVLGALVVVLASAFGLRSFVAGPQKTASPEPEPASVSSIASDESPITVIISTPNSNDCHRYELDKATGARNDKGTTKCVSEGGGNGSRIEAIAKGFRNR